MSIAQQELTGCHIPYLDSVVRVGASHFVGLCLMEAVNLLVRLVVELAVDRLSFLIHELEGVTPVPIHVSVPPGNPSV